MKHVMVLIAAHCEPEVLKNTLGTWLDVYDGSYRATVIVSVQTNYSVYSKRLGEILGMPLVEVIQVKHKSFDGSFLPHSRGHARNLRHLLQHCEGREFTHVAILDHDLEFETDFIGWAIERDADWVTALHGDRSKDATLQGQLGNGNWVYTTWSPKPSVWNMVISSRLFSRILEDTGIVIPYVSPKMRVYDTMARLYERALEWEMDVRVFPEAELNEMVRHLWSFSFISVVESVKIDDHRRKVKELQKRYAKRYPDGIGHLLKKIEK